MYTFLTVIGIIIFFAIVFTIGFWLQKKQDELKQENDLQKKTAPTTIGDIATQPTFRETAVTEQNYQSLPESPSTLSLTYISRSNVPSTSRNIKSTSIYKKVSDSSDVHIDLLNPLNPISPISVWNQDEVIEHKPIYETYTSTIHNPIYSTPSNHSVEYSCDNYSRSSDNSSSCDTGSSSCDSGGECD